VRWVGTESGYGRETEWSVVSIGNLNQNDIAANSQTSVAFKPTGDMTDNDLGSRSKIMGAKGLAWYPAETDVSIRPGWFYHPSEDTAVKSPEKLLDIYFSSVGRNGVLILNVPPNRKGLISKEDSTSLMEWKQALDATFKINLAKGATVTTTNGVNTGSIMDGKITTALTTKTGDTTTINFHLKQPVTFDVLWLQENITIGQRVENFVLEYKDGNEWKEATAGTTIGYKRLIRFNPVTAQDVRLRILSARLQPAIAEFGLYTQTNGNH
jgi:alpha-L-fucosidase